MGGNIFKNSTRLSDIEYYLLSEIIISKLKSCVQRIELIKSYKNKKSFGDMDLLISENISQEKLKNIFGIENKDISTNGNITSFLYNNFQIDLISHSIIHFDMCLFYYNYNDFGNILGKIYRRFGLKLTQENLVYLIGHKEIIISTNPKDILNFLKLKDTPITTGFIELKDIFDYFIDTPYFNKDIFISENTKRTGYVQFINYINILNEITTLPSYNKDSYITHIENFFNVDIQSQIRQYTKQINEIKELALKFNGDIIKLILGIENKELGLKMSMHKLTLTTNYI